MSGSQRTSSKGRQIRGLRQRRAAEAGKAPAIAETAPMDGRKDVPLILILMRSGKELTSVECEIANRPRDSCTLQRRHGSPSEPPDANERACRLTEDIRRSLNDLANNGLKELNLL
jgi:hypothetical protein